MCLMLYIATSHPLSERPLPHGFAVQAVSDEEREKLRGAFSKPCLRFVGWPDACSCGFPYLPVCNEPVEYFEGLLDPADERIDEVDQAQDFLDVILDALTRDPEVELYAVWAGSEGQPPKGRREVRASRVKAGEFFVMEQWFYVFS